MGNFFSSMDISSSALTAQRFKMDVIAENVANANTTRTASGGAYVKKNVVLEAADTSFSKFLNKGISNFEGGGVFVSSVENDESPMELVYNPTHPDANEEGYVEMPNVDTATEMIDMISASRSYEANITALNAFKNIAMKSLEIGN